MGRPSQRRKARAPIPVTVVSSTASSVAASFPLMLASSSRLRRVAASIASASPKSSTCSARMCGRVVRCVSRTYWSSAPAAPMASGSSSAPKPRRSSVPSWSVSSREAAASSKCQGGRSRITVGPLVGGRSALDWSSRSSSSAGRRRSSSAASVAGPRASSTVKRPELSSSQARPKRSPSRRSAARKVARLLSSRASSVTVPGVTTRTTCRSTGPFDLAGSPICSQIATDSPRRSKRPR